MVLIELNGKIGKKEKAELDNSELTDKIAMSLRYRNRLTYKYFVNSGEGLKREEALNLMDNLNEICKTQSNEIPQINVLNILISELTIYNNNAHASIKAMESYAEAIAERLLYYEAIDSCIIDEMHLKFNNMNNQVTNYENTEVLKKTLLIKVKHMMNTGCPFRFHFKTKNGEDEMMVSIKKDVVGTILCDFSGNAIIDVKCKSTDRRNFYNQLRQFMRSFEEINDNEIAS